MAQQLELVYPEEQRQRRLEPLQGLTEQLLRGVTHYVLPTFNHQLRARDDNPKYMRFDDYIDSANIVEELQRKKEDLPQVMHEWVKTTDFHRVPLHVAIPHLGEVPNSRGAKWFSLTVDVIAEGRGARRGKPVRVEDAAPDTEWQEGRISASGELKVGLGIVNDVLKFLVPGAKALPLPEANITATYKWKSEYQLTVSEAYGQHADWRISPKQGQYLDGDHDLLLILRRPRWVESLTLRIRQAEVAYDLRGDIDISRSISTLDIPVNFNASNPD